MADLEELYCNIMINNRNLRMELLLYIDELDEYEETISTIEVREKLLSLLKNKTGPKE